MKKLSILLILVVLAILIKPAIAQQLATPFTGAKASLKNYKALYVLNNGDEKKISGTLRNIKNALEDPRLKGKLEIELIVFGDGVKVYEKTGTFEQTLKDLQAKGVILAQCENTLKERHIDKSTLFPFISFVPSANGEIIIRQYQGWAIVHP
ncbi:DsrE family protein [Daejeonella sp.]|uniref:DsrE family protein n=1 Tax=Daejeonella sp. TaxID=2805397 RepID=UPI00271DECB9|nr:DsrE family protein [Daejeonella sp.]MDO8992916.1 DsrE family protein [Daejeonella sp.]MDP2415417.1 DsrE family protein [Daejeonella sp.]